MGGTMADIVNVTAYRFITIEQTKLIELQQQLLQRAHELSVLGTIYLSLEGINLSLAANAQAIESYCQFMDSIEFFCGMHYKKSISSSAPFSKMKVKIKKEIIRMDCDEVRPEQHSVPHISPQELKQWYEQKRDMLVLDTRNSYEYQAGSFDNAIELGIDNFRDFPKAVGQLPEEYKDKPIVMFCTGGVRCEKAGEYMHQQGFKQVYQLDGGIINYFVENGGAHWHGDCFVFDDRVTINSALESTHGKACPKCANLPAKAAVHCQHAA